MLESSSSANRPRPTLRLWPAVCAFGTAILLSSCQSTPSNSSSLTEARDRVEPRWQVSKSVTTPVDADASWPTIIQPLFSEARDYVEQFTDVDLSDVTLNVANDKTITKEVTHETERLIHSQFDNRQFADKFLHSVMEGQSGTYAALYATRTNQVMVSQPLLRSYQQSLPADKQIQTSALLALLIHELVHAADDRRYNIHKNRDLNFRASFAQSAAFEGHAQWVTRQICATADCLPGLTALDEFMFGTRNPPNKLTQTVQAVSRNVLEYSYVEGERFIAGLAKRANGQALIENLLSNPPQDPIQILDPDSYPNNVRENQNQQLIAASTNIEHPWLTKPWTSVQTSPLKGVNLRTDPARRNAAVDGFTRLITSMVAMQLYDQSAPGRSPIELTVIKADTQETAALFAKTLHQNTRVSGAQFSAQNRYVKVSGEQPAGMLYLTKEPTADNKTYYTLVGVNGLHVVQIAGTDTNEVLFVDYIDKLLLELDSDQNRAVATNVKFQR